MPGTNRTLKKECFLSIIAPSPPTNQFWIFWVFEQGEDFFIDPNSSCSLVGFSFYLLMAMPREGYSFHFFPFLSPSPDDFPSHFPEKTEATRKHTHMFPLTHLSVSVPVCSVFSPVTMDRLFILLSKITPFTRFRALPPSQGNDYSLPHSIYVFLFTSLFSPAIIQTCCLILKKISWPHMPTP